MSEDLERWRAWIGRHEEVADTIDVGRARAMQATLDDPGTPLGPGDALPPLSRLATTSRSSRPRNARKPPCRRQIPIDRTCRTAEPDPRP